MPVTVGHVLQATTPDNTSYEIRPSHWNSNHAVTLNLSGSDLIGAFSNNAAVTFSTNGAGAIVATVNPSAGGLTNINVSGGTTSSNVSALTFSNANGLSFGFDGSNLSGSYTVPTVTSPLFSNSNGFTFGSNAGTVTASYNSTSAAGQGTTFSGTNISASATLNTAGLNLALSAGAGGANQAISYYEQYPWRGAQSFAAALGSIGQSTVMYVQPFVVDWPISCYRGMLLNSASTLSSTLSMSLPVSTTLANSTGSARASTTWTLALFSRVSTGTDPNSSNISQFASTTVSSSIAVAFTNSSSTNASSATVTISSIFSLGFISQIDSAGGITTGSATVGGSTSTTVTTTASSNFSFAASASAHNNLITGARPLDFALATSLSPGEYWFGLRMGSGSASAGGTAAMQNLVIHTPILYGATSTPTQMFRFGTSSNAASTTFPEQGWGSVSSAQTSTTIGINQITSNLNGAQTWFNLMGATL